MQLTDALQAIRPGRESQTGWTWAAARLAGNHSSWELNERGSALKVFWSRPGRDGRKVGEHVHLPERAHVIKEWLTNKTKPEGAGPDQSGPLLSVRARVQPGHHPDTR